MYKKKPQEEALKVGVKKRLFLVKALKGLLVSF